MIQFILDADAQAICVRQNTNSLFQPFGLDFEHPPAESFRAIAHERSSLGLCRIINTIHMMRITWLNTVARQLKRLLDDPKIKRDQTTVNAWINLRVSVETTARSEADLLLSTLPIYIPADESPLSPTSVASLVWSLSTFGVSPLLSSAQQASAKEGLVQIGQRAKISAATKLANAQFSSDSKLSEEAHLVHFSWHF
jgi:hypothetical protein